MSKASHILHHIGSGLVMNWGDVTWHEWLVSEEGNKVMGNMWGQHDVIWGGMGSVHQLLDDSNASSWPSLCALIHNHTPGTHYLIPNSTTYTVRTLQCNHHTPVWIYNTVTCRSPPWHKGHGYWFNNRQSSSWSNIDPGELIALPSIWPSEYLSSSYCSVELTQLNPIFIL